MKKLFCYIALLFLSTAIHLSAQEREMIPFSDFEQWVTRNMTESKLLGGHDRTLFAIAPTATIEGAVAYRNMGGSPWATSNAYANVVGIKKASCTVVPEERSDRQGMCARLDSKLEVVRVLGMVDI